MKEIKLLQKDLDKMYKWVNENLMQFNDNKFEWMSHVDTGNIFEGVYRTKSSEEIKENRTVKGLRLVPF